MPDLESITFVTFVIWMVDVTIITNLIPDRTSFEQFSSTLRKLKKMYHSFWRIYTKFWELKGE